MRRQTTGLRFQSFPRKRSLTRRVLVARSPFQSQIVKSRRGKMDVLFVLGLGKLKTTPCFDVLFLTVKGVPKKSEISAGNVNGISIWTNTTDPISALPKAARSFQDSPTQEASCVTKERFTISTVM